MYKQTTDFNPLSLLKHNHKYNPSQSQTIKLGVSGNLGGHTRELCTGVYLAIEDWSVTSPLYSLEIVWAEDVLEESTVSEAANYLVQQGVQAVIGHLASTEALKAAPLYEKNKILYLAPATSHPDITQQNYKHVLRFFGQDHHLANKMVEFSLKSLKSKNVTIIKQHNKHGNSLSQLLKCELRKNDVSDITEITWEEGDTRIPDYCEAILFAGTYQVGSKVIKELYRRGNKSPIVMADDAYISEFPFLGGDAAEGVYVVSTGHDPTHPQYPAFLERYHKHSGSQPGAYSITSYIATKLLLSSLSERDVGCTDSLLKWFYSKSQLNNHLMGSLLFDDQNNLANFPWAIYQVQNGYFKKLR
ncbi:ABC-type branched-chain amino acid transport system, substrate-binding protein [Marininema mesophilum]|uniref:ABC-type branched-chain amino acid transport system, substrate-binding protein n=1 Tax=Marininema mesophilum TaxID=1048340 RepID=A0A1H3C4V3_9BACL|nr:branched-chain amino acid ABC transporter substrate-binding protein [Marininema mesophilum]SDX49070.1 ABC-type branched-chain amino acid transport system, substrate-binding protein [Marininema mesophilum]